MTRPPQVGRTRSLDLGCGANPILPDADLQVGLDIDFESLLRGRQLKPQVHYVCADGERLPFADATFDVVASRVVLPYMNLNAAIPEVSRILKPSGYVTLTLHHFGFEMRDLLRRIRSGHPKAIITGLWAILNGFIFWIFGRTLKLPFSRHGYDSFQTYSGMKRILQKEGFSGPLYDFYVIKAFRGAKPGSQSTGFFSTGGRTLEYSKRKTS